MTTENQAENQAEETDDRPDPLDADTRAAVDDIISKLPENIVSEASFLGGRPVEVSIRTVISDAMTVAEAVEWFANQLITEGLDSLVVHVATVDTGDDDEDTVSASWLLQGGHVLTADEIRARLNGRDE